MKDLCKYKPIEGLRPVEFGDDLALMKPETGEYLVINDVGKDIWRLLDGTNTVADIITELTKIYDVTELECEDSIVEFINKLRSNKLLSS